MYNKKAGRIRYDPKVIVNNFGNGVGKLYKSLGLMEMSLMLYIQTVITKILIITWRISMDDDIRTIDYTSK